MGADQCTACQLAICGMKWKCKDCPRCSLCTPCYMLGRHGHDHNFERIDSPKYVSKIKTAEVCVKLNCSTSSLGFQTDGYIKHNILEVCII